MSGKSLFCSDVPDVVIKSNFEKYDKDGSNVLEKNEMLAMLCELGLDEKQAEVCFMMIDKDGSTSVSKHEFMEWFKSGEGVKFVDDQERYTFVRGVADAFKLYDRDASGTIDRDEFRALLATGGKDWQSRSEEEIENALRNVDKDGSGTVSFPEFLAWMDSFKT